MTASSVDPELKDNPHLLTIAEWERVVQEAEAICRDAALADKFHEALLAPRHLGKGSFPSINGFIQAKYHGGSQTPRFGVLHDAETPLANGYALSISNYFTRNTNETSAHFMLGPDAGYQLLDTSLIGWHCGNGNRGSVGVEMAGYASLTRTNWLSDAGTAQIHRLAALMNELKAAHGIGTYFMTDQQLRDAYAGRIVGGWATHDQCRRVLGGTTHTDPMPNFPFDVLTSYLGGAPTPPPAPQPTKQVPARLNWILPRGHYIGDINGPNNCHGGDPRYDSRAVIELVQNCQEWLIYHDCVPGVSRWEASSWDDGRFSRPYSTDATIRWHAKFYPHQPKPDQIWSDDYDRLARA